MKFVLSPHPRRALAALLLVWLTIGACGCAARSTLRQSEVPTSRAVEGIGKGFFEPEVQAFVVPPADWELEPPKGGDRHAHLVWLSPTGETAYGVIYARLPGYLPTAFIPSHYLHEKVLDRFLDEMRSDQGEARLLSKRWDASDRGLHFEAEGGLYRLQSLLNVRGRSAWAVYTGTHRDRGRNEREIALADRARDATRVGRSAADVQASSR